MFLLVFDTETNGLAHARIDNYTNLSSPVTVLQWSYLIYDLSKGKVVLFRNFLLSYPTFSIAKHEWSPSAEAVHHIDYDTTVESGQPMVEALWQFIQDLETYPDAMLVGHNVHYDHRVICLEWYRSLFDSEARQWIVERNLFSRWTQSLHRFRRELDKLCTMLYFQNVCQLRMSLPNGGSRVKYPKLGEVNSFLFHQEPFDLHNAMVDVWVTLRCYLWHAQQRRLPETPEFVKRIVSSKGRNEVYWKKHLRSRNKRCHSCIA